MNPQQSIRRQALMHTYDRLIIYPIAYMLGGLVLGVVFYLIALGLNKPTSPWIIVVSSIIMVSAGILLGVIHFIKAYRTIYTQISLFTDVQDLLGPNPQNITNTHIKASDGTLYVLEVTCSADNTCQLWWSSTDMRATHPDPHFHFNILTPDTGFVIENYCIPLPKRA